MKGPSFECIEALHAIGCSVRSSPTNLVTWRVHVDPTEDNPGMFIGEMSEREIWSWLDARPLVKESIADEE